MTTLAPPAHPTPHEPDPTSGQRLGWLATLRAWLPDVAVVALLAWWATYFTWGTGGREPRLLSVACVLAALAWVAVRPERTLSPWALLPSAALAAGACLVVAFSPTGWAGRDDAGAWVLAAATGPVLLTWAGGPVDSRRIELRRTLLVVALLGAGGAQFAAGWLPWWGAQDPAKLFQGTFYWHNQVGIFLAVIGILALAVVVLVWRIRRERRDLFVLALVLELNLHPPLWVHILLWTPLTTIAVVASLRVAKGALLTLEYRNRAREGRIANKCPDA